MKRYGRQWEPTLNGWLADDEHGRHLLTRSLHNVGQGWDWVGYVWKTRPGHHHPTWVEQVRGIEFQPTWKRFAREWKE